MIFGMYPVNSPAVLCHWRVLTTILAAISEEKRELFKVFVNTLCQPADSILGEGPLRVFDSHWHVDRCHTNLKSTKSPEELTLHTLESPPVLPVDVKGGVLVFCDPGSYPQTPLDPMWRIAVGFHTKHEALPESTIRRISSLMDQPTTAALGEIGLDWSAHPRTYLQQERHLDRILEEVASPRKLIVFHFRGVKGDPYSSAVSALGMCVAQRH